MQMTVYSSKTAAKKRKGMGGDGDDSSTVLMAAHVQPQNLLMKVIQDEAQKNKQQQEDRLSKTGGIRLTKSSVPRVTDAEALQAHAHLVSQKPSGRLSGFNMVGMVLRVVLNPNRGKPIMKDGPHVSDSLLILTGSNREVSGPISREYQTVDIVNVPDRIERAIVVHSIFSSGFLKDSLNKKEDLVQSGLRLRPYFAYLLPHKAYWVSGVANPNLQQGDIVEVTNMSLSTSGYRLSKKARSNDQQQQQQPMIAAESIKPFHVGQTTGSSSSSSSSSSFIGQKPLDSHLKTCSAKNSKTHSGSRTTARFSTFSNFSSIESRLPPFRPCAFIRACVDHGVLTTWFPVPPLCVKERIKQSEMEAAGKGPVQTSHALLPHNQVFFIRFDGGIPQHYVPHNPIGSAVNGGKGASGLDAIDMFGSADDDDDDGEAMNQKERQGSTDASSSESGCDPLQQTKPSTRSLDKDEDDDDDDDDDGFDGAAQVKPLFDPESFRGIPEYDQTRFYAEKMTNNMNVRDRILGFRIMCQIKQRANPHEPIIRGMAWINAYSEVVSNAFAIVSAEQGQWLLARYLPLCDVVMVCRVVEEQTARRFENLHNIFVDECPGKNPHLNPFDLIPGDCLSGENTQDIARFDDLVQSANGGRPLSSSSQRYSSFVQKNMTDRAELVDDDDEEDFEDYNQAGLEALGHLERLNVTNPTPRIEEVVTQDDDTTTTEPSTSLVHQTVIDQDNKTKEDSLLIVVDEDRGGGGDDDKKKNASSNDHSSKHKGPYSDPYASLIGAAAAGGGGMDAMRLTSQGEFNEGGERAASALFGYVLSLSYLAVDAFNLYKRIGVPVSQRMAVAIANQWRFRECCVEPARSAILMRTGIMCLNEQKNPDEITLLASKIRSCCYRVVLDIEGFDQEIQELLASLNKPYEGSADILEGDVFMTFLSVQTGRAFALPNMQSIVRKYIKTDPSTGARVIAPPSDMAWGKAYKFFSEKLGPRIRLNNLGFVFFLADPESRYQNENVTLNLFFNGKRVRNRICISSRFPSSSASSLNNKTVSDGVDHDDDDDDDDDQGKASSKKPRFESDHSFSQDSKPHQEPNQEDSVQMVEKNGDDDDHEKSDHAGGDDDDDDDEKEGDDE